ncbi:hypothetical protein [Pedobacter sp. SL55]|uniref:hypothetical protein n=1 Tax=Pedobacter sp. SL55 TaxID=2995161 RepID=UPI002271113E|nr:hypothetical protein [Pedobacter sp. SL55]WAC40923.1 hypothetical protein OVA16_00600 [Pedobacter sp. SL55]
MFLYKRKYADRSTTIIFYYLIAAGLINVTAIALARNGIRNLPLLHLYTVVETVFFLVTSGPFSTVQELRWS